MINTDLFDFYLVKSGLKIGYICDRLGITRQAFGYKRKGKLPFKKAEQYVLCDLLHITDDKDAIFLP